MFIHNDGWKDSNDVVWAVAKRARELVDMSMDELRLLATNDPEGRIGSARREFIGWKKADLIEKLLTEEGIEDFPPCFEEHNPADS